MRIKFLTKNPLQTKYLFLILLSILAPIFVVGGCLYYILFQVMAEQLAIPESIAYNLIPVLQRVNLILIIGMPPIILLLLWWGVVLTHKLIGPLERLEEGLRKISKGDYFMRVKIRKDDDLKPIADVINDIVEKLEKK